MKTPKTKPDLVERVMASKCDVSAKVVKLFAVTQLHYRAPLGDKAWDKMRDLIGADAVSALAFITGFCLASDMKGDYGKRLAELVPEL